MELTRSIQIITQENTEWTRYMSGENERTGLIRYAITLIVLANIAQAIGSSMFWSFGGFGVAMPYFMTMYGLQLLLGVAALFFIPRILASLAPNFGGTNNELNALKLYVYAMTPAWLGMIFTFIPMLGWLVAFAGGIYAIYLFWKRCGEALSIPDDKKPIFVLTSVVVLAVTFAIIGWIATMIVGGIFGAAYFGMHRGFM